MTLFDYSIDFSNNDGEELTKNLQSISDYLQIIKRAQKVDITSGELNRIPFYASEEEVLDIQNQLDGTSIMLIAIPSDGLVDIWVISKTYAYPLRAIGGSGGSSGILSLNGIINQSEINLTAGKNTSIQVLTDSTTSKKYIEISSQDGGSSKIYVESINGIKNQKEISFRAGNQITVNVKADSSTGQDYIEISAIDSGAIQSINEISGQENVDIVGGRNISTSIKIDPNTAQRYVDVSSTFVPKFSVLSVNKINNQENIDILGGKHTSVSVKTNPSTSDSYIEVEYTGHDTAGISNINNINNQERVDFKAGRGTEIVVKTDISTAQKYVEINSTIKQSSGIEEINGINDQKDIDFKAGVSALVTVKVDPNTGKKFVEISSTALKSINGIEDQKEINLIAGIGSEIKVKTDANTGKKFIEIGSSLVGAIQNINGIDNQSEIDFRAGKGSVITVKTDPNTNKRYIEIQSTGSSTAIESINGIANQKEVDFRPGRGADINVRVDAQTKNKYIEIGNNSIDSINGIAKQREIDFRGINGVKVSSKLDPVSTKKYVEISASGSSLENAIPNSIYYDDNSKATSQDGSVNLPYKLLQEAIAEASKEANRTKKRYTVRVKENASLINTEDLHIGGQGKSMSITIFAPNLSLSGSMVVDLETDVIKDLNRLSIICNVSSLQISVINAKSISITGIQLPYAIIQLKCAQKNISQIKHSFSCDLSKLDKDNTKLKNAAIYYTEEVGEALENPAKSTTPLGESILFTVSDKLKNSTLIAEYNINSVSIIPTETISETSYIRFVAPTRIDPSNNMLAYGLGVPKNGRVWDYVLAIGSSYSYFITGALLKHENAEISRLYSASLQTNSLTVDERLKLPYKDGTMIKDGDISYHNNDGLTYVHSKGVDKPLRYSSETGTVDTLETYVSGEVYSRTQVMDIKIAPLFSIASMGVSGLRHHEGTISINQTEEKIINTRRREIILDKVVYTRAKSTDEYMKDSDTEGHALLKLLGGITSYTFDKVKLANDAYYLHIAYNSEDAKTIEANLKTGFVYSFMKTGSEPLAMILIEKPAFGVNSASLLVAANIGHGQTRYDQPASADVANILLYDKLYIGCGVGAFDWKHDYSIIPNGGWVNFIYWPVMFQNKHAKLASNTAVFLVPHNARNWDKDLKSKAGERAFKKEIMPPIILESACVILGIPKENVNYEWLRIPIYSRSYSISGSSDFQNNDIVMSSFHSTVIGNTFITKLTTVLGDVSNPATLLASADYPDVNKYPKSLAESGNLAGSYYQDNPIDRIDFAMWKVPSSAYSASGTVDLSTNIYKFGEHINAGDTVSCYFGGFLGLPVGLAPLKEKVSLGLYKESSEYIIPFKIFYKMVSQTSMNIRTSGFHFDNTVYPVSTISNDPKSVFQFI